MIGGGRGWGQHGECEARPQRGPGAAESILVIRCPTEPANLARFLKCLALQGMNGLTVSIA